MIKRFLLTILLWLMAWPALAQNVTCATRPVSDNSNACASTAFVQTIVAGVTSRSKLTANTSFYVRSDGNDTACTGLVDAAYASGSYPQNCRFATPQGAHNSLLARWDMAGFQATVLITGNYSIADYVLNVNGPYVGSSPTSSGYPGPNTCPVIYRSASGVATDVTLTSTTIDAVLGANGAVFCIQDMTLVATNGSGFHAGWASINFGNIIFGTTGRSWIWSGHDSIIENYSSFSLSGNSVNGFESSFQSSLFFTGASTVTLLADITVTCTATADRNSEISFSNMTINLNGHTVTGKRFCISNSSAIISGAGSRTYLPGTVAGTNDLGSSYDGDNIVTGGTTAGDSVTIQSTSNAAPLNDNIALKATFLNVGWPNIATRINLGAAGFGGSIAVSGSTSGNQIWQPAAATSGTITW